jgi:hypothetical protein
MDANSTRLGVKGGRKTPLPTWVKPQLAALVKKAPDGPDWLYEVKTRWLSHARPARCRPSENHYATRQMIGRPNTRQSPRRWRRCRPIAPTWTRALLRRGHELGGWWPYALGLVDAGPAAVVIAALALTMVVGVQAFDTLAVHGGGAAVLPLEPLFDGISISPSAPEYWWIYASCS